VSVNSKGGFSLDNGEGIRFWGGSIAGKATIPPKEKSPLIAQRLAKLGFNLVRITRIGRFIVEDKSPTEVKLDKEALDRFDYLVKELKDKGIYIELSLIGTWRFHAPDKIKAGSSPMFTETYEGRRLLQALGMFDPSVYNLQKQYAKKLLTHKNPYTNLTYADEPALASLEIINETTLTYSWLRGYLKSSSPKNLHLTEYYSRELDILWNTWLRNKYGSDEALKEAWNLDSEKQQALSESESLNSNSIRRISYKNRREYPIKRRKDMVTFYHDLEEEFFLRFKNYLREELGLKQLLSGAHNYHGMPNQLTQAQMDFSGGHAQWQHPIFPSGEAWPIRILNTPMVKEKKGSIPYKADWIETRNTIYRIAFGMASANQPTVVSEYNHAFPNEYLAEFPLLISAYGRFQGWDGIVIHSYLERLNDLVPESSESIIDHPFITFNNPVLMAQMPLVSELFRKGYINEAKNSLTLNYSKEKASNSFLECGFDIYCETNRLGVDPRLALTHKVRNDYSSESNSEVIDESPPAPDCSNNVCLSDTDQLLWNLKKGLVVINSDYVQAATGFTRGRSIRLENLTMTPKTDFMSIGLVTLDEKPIGNSSKMLITATSRVKNKGMELKKDLIGLYRINSWGSGPTLVQDVKAKLKLNLSPKKEVKVFALDHKGKKREELTVKQKGSTISFSIGGHETLWYGITVGK